MLSAFEFPASTQQKIATRWLALAALVAVALWYGLETWSVGTHSPRLLDAAERMARASGVIREAKLAQRLLQPIDVDRNRTGLIGPEWSEITTTIGVLEAKRTFANPDLAALIVRIFDSAGLVRGDRIAIVLSGSFVGGNVAVLAAAESAGLRPVIVSSLAASMFGATDPSFTWLDMEAAVRATGAWQARSDLAVLGGEGGHALDLPSAARDLLRAAAKRHGVPIVEETGFERTVERLEAVLALDSIKFLVNVGGAQIALGTCRQAEQIPAGVVRGRIACTDGTPGLVQRALDRGVPTLNLFKVKEFARRYGLPYDPTPLLTPGENRAIYR